MGILRKIKRTKRKIGIKVHKFIRSNFGFNVLQLLSAIFMFIICWENYKQGNLYLINLYTALVAIQLLISMHWHKKLKKYYAQMHTTHNKAYKYSMRLLDDFILKMIDNNR